MRRTAALPVSVTLALLLAAGCGGVSTADPDSGADRPKDTAGSTSDTGAPGGDAGGEVAATAEAGAPDAAGPDGNATETTMSTEAGDGDGGASDVPTSEGGAPAPVLLTAAKAGTGTGTITSTPAGIACGADCSESFAAGTMVTLAAAPDASSTFGGWSGGGCTGASTCVVTLAAATTVTATFTLKAWTLMTALAGTGGGAISSTPAGITCGATCMASYGHGTMVTLTATPNGQSLFTAWGGACAGSGTCVVTMDQARSVTATFTQQSYGLTVTRTGTGAATSSVASTPAGITCGADCSEAYAAGTMVTLTATPGGGASFAGWSGGGCSGTGACAVTIDAIVNVTANFTLSRSALTVIKGGNGAGTVTSSPAGISCGATCSEQVDYGAMVTLSATPTAGSAFSGWSGGGCSGAGTTCTVTVTAATMVTAGFTLLQFPVSVTKAGSGAGTVTSNMGGITCGATCTATLNYGSMVALSAAPGAGSTFDGWSGGGCSGTSTCLVTVGGPVPVTATFSKATYVLTVDFQGASAGSVSISPGGTSLAADGFATLAAGASVTLTATPAFGVGFGGWGGACSGFGACSFTLGADTTVTVKFDPPNKVFVTSTKHAPGMLGGLANADAICATRASAGGLAGTFKAFLGSTNADAWSRLAGARGWARRDGKPFGDSVADLMAGRTYYPVIQDETGLELPAGQTLVITGRAGGAVQTCMDWTSTGGGLYDATWGDPRSGWLTFAANGGTACNNTNMRLYCFEVSRSVSFKPPVVPNSARRAFLSSGNLAGNGGVAAADTQCQSEATSAGLPGTYKAMLAGNGTTAAARFTAGTAWYRTDGVQLSATAADLLIGTTTLWAAMSLRADGLTQEQALAWTGAPNVATAGAAAGTCAGWASTASTTTYTTYGNRMGTDWFGPFTSGACTDTHRVFCFQQ